MKIQTPIPWESPISSASIFESKKTISNLQAWKDGLLFLITEPDEGNINILMYSDTNSVTRRVSPKGFNIRSKIHEYGGRPFTAEGNDIFYCNFSDQEIYSQSFLPESNTFSSPVAVTDSLGDKVRYADLTIDRKRNRLIVVREDHRFIKASVDEAKNSLITVSLNTLEFPTGIEAQTILFEGSDFLSSPNISEDGKNLAFITWQHPNMPWDNTELIVAKMAEEGHLYDVQRVDGNSNSSKTQPFFITSKKLFFLSDESDYWNLRSYDLSPEQSDVKSESVYQIEADCCGPPWVTGKRNFSVIGSSEVVISVVKACEWNLHLVNFEQKTEKIIHAQLGSLDDIVSSEKNIFYLAADDRNYPGIYCESIKQLTTAIRAPLIQPRIPDCFNEAIISEPKHLTFRTDSGDKAYGIYYGPKNNQLNLPPNILPPLIINVHGGPTGTAQAALNPMHQFWTSRGFAVFDLNHRGSTGYGRTFRQKLYGQWGIADVRDAINAVEHLVKHDLANADQIAIRGGSAGGYLVLACLADSDIFSAGVSYYGIADLELLTKDTHKFESRYLERLIGPYPEKIELYKNRSPIGKLQSISAPVFILQGKLDKIVPPNQADLLYAELVKRNSKTQILCFEDEGHGFRKPSNQIKALDRELAFYKKNLF